MKLKQVETVNNESHGGQIIILIIDKSNQVHVTYNAPPKVALFHFISFIPDNVRFE
jgi:hypothetical protein